MLLPNMEAALSSVSDVAKELGLSERRVRALIESGQLPAQRVGRSWLVSREAVERSRRSERRHGRPLGAANSWALLALLAGEKPAWVRPDVLSRLRRYARDPEWLLNVLRHSESRAKVRSLWLAHDDLPKLNEYPLVRSGLSAPRALSQLDVLPRSSEPLDAYASKDVAREIVKRFAPEEDVGDPNVIIRVPELPWVLGNEGEAPLSVGAADLLDHDDPRVRRAGSDALRKLALAG
jgi:excisionase family DNA binding protein